MKEDRGTIQTSTDRTPTAWCSGWRLGSFWSWLRPPPWSSRISPCLRSERRWWSGNSPRTPAAPREPPPGPWTPPPHTSAPRAARTPCRPGSPTGCGRWAEPPPPDETSSCREAPPGSPPSWWWTGCGWQRMRTRSLDGEKTEEDKNKTTTQIIMCDYMKPGRYSPMKPPSRKHRSVKHLRTERRWVTTWHPHVITEQHATRGSSADFNTL